MYVVIITGILIYYKMQHTFGVQILKKKLIIIFTLTFLSLSTLFAKVDYRFDFASFDPLHKEYFADIRRPELSISYLSYSQGFPTYVIQDQYINSPTEENSIMRWDFKGDIKPSDTMVELKIGETYSMARSTFIFDSFLSPIAFDITAQGSIQQFYLGGFDDSFGYDGVFFYGGSFSIGDFLSMRIGNQHYCSHYGDIIFKKIKDSPSHSYDDFWITYKYVRMDNFAFGLSIKPTSFSRIYGELKYPPKWIKSVRPDMFAPNWVVRDGITINEDYPDDYNARIVNVGFELEYPIFKKIGFGNTTIGYDLYMYEEGKVQYEQIDGGTITFDPDAPWELEHNFRLAQELNDVISFEIFYHNGRSPFNNFFNFHTEILGFTARFNPKSSITFVDTK